MDAQGSTGVPQHAHICSAGGSSAAYLSNVSKIPRLAVPNSRIAPAVHRSITHPPLCCSCLRLHSCTLWHSASHTRTHMHHSAASVPICAAARRGAPRHAGTWPALDPTGAVCGAAQPWLAAGAWRGMGAGRCGGGAAGVCAHMQAAFKAAGKGQQVGGSWRKLQGLFCEHSKARGSCRACAGGSRL